MSARQSPPTPVATARSSSTFAGPCTTSGRRQGSNAVPSNRSSPSVRILSINSTARACETTPEPAASTLIRGYNLVDLPTRKVL